LNINFVAENDPHEDDLSASEAPFENSDDSESMNNGFLPASVNDNLFFSSLRAENDVFLPEVVNNNLSLPGNTKNYVNVSFHDILKRDVEKYASYFFSLKDISRKRSFEIFSGMTSFSNGDAFCLLERKVIERLTALGESFENIDEFRQTFDDLRNPIDVVNLNSEHKLKTCFAKNGSMILPKQIIVGEREDYAKIKRKICLKENESLIPPQQTAESDEDCDDLFDNFEEKSENIKEGPPVMVKINVTIEFIELREVLTKFFELPGVFQETMDYIDFLEHDEDDIVSNFIQGDFWRNLKSLQPDDKVILPLMIYFDDYEVNNPLGGHTGIHKCGAVYALIPCLPPAYISKLENIFLFLLFNSSDRTALGNQAIFEKAIDEIQFLENTGINILDNITVYFRMVLVTGDNLGVHALLGFVESFVANFFCRMCKMHKSDIQTIFHESQCTLRTEFNYDEDVEKNNVTATGINCECIFNGKFLSFHAIRNIFVDVMHDLLEGVIKNDLTLILTYFIKIKLFSWDFLWTRINGFDYDENDKRSRPTTRDVNKMSASEVLCFLRILPLLVGDKIEVDDEYWNLVILLNSITEIVFSKSVNKNCHFFLSAQIEEYLETLCKLFQNPLKPKHHHLVHYPRVLREMGPLGNISSMRCEGKHRWGKTVSKVSTNRINVQHSIALKEQYILNHRLIMRASSSSADFVSGSINRPVEIDIDVFHRHGIFSEKRFYPTKWVQVLGRYISGFTILMTPGEEGELEFIQVRRIYRNDDYKILIVGNVLECNFDYHLQSYEVTGASSSLRFIKYSDIISYFISYKVQFCSSQYIIKKWI